MPIPVTTTSVVELADGGGDKTAVIGIISEISNRANGSDSLREIRSSPPDSSRIRAIEKPRF
jgi:hypothetical protein